MKALGAKLRLDYADMRVMCCRDFGEGRARLFLAGWATEADNLDLLVESNVERGAVINVNQFFMEMNSIFSIYERYSRAEATPALIHSGGPEPGMSEGGI